MSAHRFTQEVASIRDDVQHSGVLSTDTMFNAMGRGSGGSGGDRARVLDVRGLVLVSGLGERRVGSRLVQVDVGDVQTDVVFSLQAGQDGGDGRHQRGKVGPQLGIGVPALKHDAVPGIGRASVRARIERTTFLFFKHFTGLLVVFLLYYSSTQQNFIV